MIKVLKISDIIKKNSNIEIDILLAFVLKKPKEFLFMNGENRLTRIQADKLTRMVRRREKGEPVAYILGYKDFYGLRFKVNKNVLIPRPETEGMVETVIASVVKIFMTSEVIPMGKRLPRPSQSLGARNDNLTILDIGTGSGCIAITLAKQFKISNFKFQITASDISAKALAVAKQNAKAHHVKIIFVKSDLLKNIKVTPDIIIANLPYGWNQWKNNTSAATIGLKFEPKEALFTKENGLYEIHRLLKQIALLPSLPKYVYLEFDPRQKTGLSKLVKKYLPKGDIKFYKDFNNLWRFAEITI